VQSHQAQRQSHGYLRDEKAQTTSGLILLLNLSGVNPQKMAINLSTAGIFPALEVQL